MITQILPSALAALGDPTFSDTLDLTASIGPARSVAVLLVDGMGSRLVPRSTRLRAALAAGTNRELQCAVPSTTPVSLVSFGTGLPPGAHGVLGFRVNVPGTDTVLTHVTWRDDPDPAWWAPQPTVFSRSSVRSTVVLPAEFGGSGLTDAAYRGAAFVGRRRGDDLVDAMVQAVLARPGLVIGYVASVDAAAHVHGVGSMPWQQACADAATVIERLVSSLPGDAALLVTADHGCLDIPLTSRLEIRDDRRLTAGLRVVAGEPRLRYLHTVPGAVDDVLDTWRDVLGDRADVMTRAQAVESGMFGPVEERFAERIGDIVVVCTGDSAVFASGWESDETARLVGLHGSVSTAELAIPLVSFPSR